MRKITAVLLSVILLLALCPMSVFADNTSLKLTVATDVHLNAVSSFRPVTQSTDTAPFAHGVSNGKMTAESYAIVKAFLNDVANNDSEFLIITGDVADMGDLVHEEKVAEMLKAFEVQTGKTVLCGMGNHESYGGTTEQFKAVFADLGYDKALSIHATSASYTADLKGRYRFICIDTNCYNADLEQWIAEQVSKAKTDGKVLISATHFSLMPHFTFQKIATDTTLDSTNTVAERFIDWGIRFNFSGHTHELDIASYENDKGTVYDIASGSVTTYPACYRTVEFGSDTVNIDTKYISGIDINDVPDGLAQQAYELLAADFRAYAKKMFIEGSHTEFKYFLSTSFFKTYGVVKEGTDDEIIKVLDTVLPRVYEATLMPLYGEENSLDNLAKEYGYTLRPSGFADGLYAFCEMYAQHCAGDENNPTYSDLGDLCLNIFGTALSYALDDLTDRQLRSVIDWALAKANLTEKVPLDAVSLVVAALQQGTGVHALVFYVIAPLANDFLDDNAPDDVKVVLMNYGSENNQVLSFMDRVAAFFKKIFLYIYTFFSFFPNFFG